MVVKQFSQPSTFMPFRFTLMLLQLLSLPMGRNKDGQQLKSGLLSALFYSSPRTFGTAKSCLPEIGHFAANLVSGLFLKNVFHPDG